MGKGSFKYAWVLDKLKVEGKRGISIDIALWKFETDKTQVLCHHAPSLQVISFDNSYSCSILTSLDLSYFRPIAVSSSLRPVFVSSRPVSPRTARPVSTEHALLAYPLAIKQLIVGVIR